jgi:TetR/AcrR family transcriptional regulator, tetracycline repressor protein
LLDRDGLGRFSLRRLAEHLGVTPMAVYNHVNSKRDLLQAIADRVVDDVHYRPVGRNWETTVRSCFRTLREACLRHPGAVPVVESADVLPASVFRPIEITMKALQNAGLRSDDALRAYFVLVTFTLGQVSYQVKGWSTGVDPATAVRRGLMSPTTFPVVIQTVAAEKWDFEKFFEFGLSLIVAGLRARVSKR